MKKFRARKYFLSLGSLALGISSIGMTAILSSCGSNYSINIKVEKYDASSSALYISYNYKAFIKERASILKPTTESGKVSQDKIQKARFDAFIFSLKTYQAAYQIVSKYKDTIMQVILIDPSIDEPYDHPLSVMPIQKFFTNAFTSEGYFFNMSASTSENPNPNNPNGIPLFDSGYNPSSFLNLQNCIYIIKGEAQTDWSDNAKKEAGLFSSSVIQNALANYFERTAKGFFSSDDDPNNPHSQIAKDRMNIIKTIYIPDLEHAIMYYSMEQLLWNFTK